MLSVWHAYYIHLLTQGNTALDIAANDNIRQILQLNDATKHYDRQLMAAADAGDLTKVRELVQTMKGSSALQLRLANIAAKDEGGLTALHLAARRGHIDVMKCLLDHKVRWV